MSQLNLIVPKQKITAAEKQKEIEALAANLKEQAPQIQKVSAQLELSKSAPQTALNNQ
jgi:aspartate ammonia-lyase